MLRIAVGARAASPHRRARTRAPPRPHARGLLDLDPLVQHDVGEATCILCSLLLIRSP